MTTAGLFPDTTPVRPPAHTVEFILDGQTTTMGAVLAAMADLQKKVATLEGQLAAVQNEVLVDVAKQTGALEKSISSMQANYSVQLDELKESVENDLGTKLAAQQEVVSRLDPTAKAKADLKCAAGAHRPWHTQAAPPTLRAAARVHMRHVRAPWLLRAGDYDRDRHVSADGVPAAASCLSVPRRATRAYRAAAAV